MTEASRLLHAGTEAERALLRAGADEEPSRESVSAAARALGLAPRVALFASLGALLSRAISRAIQGSPMTTFIVAPVVLAGVVTAAVVAGRAVTRPPIHALAPPVPAQAAPSPQGIGASLQPTPASQVDVLPMTQGPAAPAKDAPAAVHAKAAYAANKENAATASRASQDADLAEQVRLVDRARALVAGGDASAALAAADAYDRRFPRGILAEEAALVRIQATEARGDRVEAASLARRFLAQYPESVHRSKVQWLLGDGTK